MPLGECALLLRELGRLTSPCCAVWCRRTTWTCRRCTWSPTSWTPTWSSPRRTRGWSPFPWTPPCPWRSLSAHRCLSRRRPRGEGNEMVFTALQSSSCLWQRLRAGRVCVHLCPLLCNGVGPHNSRHLRVLSTAPPPLGLGATPWSSISPSRSLSPTLKLEGPGPDPSLRKPQGGPFWREWNLL